MYINEDKQKFIILAIYVILSTIFALLLYSVVTNNDTTSNDNSIQDSSNSNETKKGTPKVVANLSSQEKEDLAKNNISDEDILGAINKYLQKLKDKQYHIETSNLPDDFKDMEIELAIHNFSLSTSSILSKNSDLLTFVINVDIRNTKGEYDMFSPKYTIIRIYMNKKTLEIKEEEVIYCYYCENQNK